MKHAKCPEDKLNIQFFHLSLLALSSNGNAALKSGLAVVSNLGIDIPSNPSQELIQQNIQYTQSMLARLSEHEILNYQMMTNTRLIAVMKFLARLQGIAFLVKPALQSILILEMVQITISEGKTIFLFKYSNACFWTVHLSNNFSILLLGLCPDSAFGFACLGSFVARLGNLKFNRRAPIRFTCQVFIEQARCKRISG
jgi:hypothetical protein